MNMEKEEILKFGEITFVLNDGKISSSLSGKHFQPITEIQVEGRNKNTHLGNKIINSSESFDLISEDLTQYETSLCITQTNSRLSVKTEYEKFEDCNALEIKSTVYNKSDETICLSEITSAVIGGLFGKKPDVKKIFIYKFFQSHHCECQPRKLSFYDLGFSTDLSLQLRIYGVNVGSWSTKEELPQAIIEYDGKFFMFQVESNNSWYWEIAKNNDDTDYYLALGTDSVNFTGWTKKLKKGEEFSTDTVAICFGNSLDGVIGEMTKYRRHITGKCVVDKALPTIFNEYMHLSWDSPDENNTRKIAPTVAELRVNYYVIDCGWHNEEDGNIVYPYVGQWKESKKRFPSGLKKTMDFIRSLGLKPGLWIEPEIIGCKCNEMLHHYDDDCFITRNGKKIAVQGRYFLDYRNEKVRKYLSEAIRRMIEDYGAEYIKLDYNQDLGIGTDKDSGSLGEGLKSCSEAYLKWVDEIREQYPAIMFETCSSGGMRADYETLRHFSIISTSDQTDYLKYPAIVSNILSAVLPEQAAVWSYPVDVKRPIGEVYEPTKEWVEENISEEQIIFNMINSLLGRMHLASRINLLSDKKKNLIKEGVRYFESLSEFKKNSLPVFPLGFADFSSEMIAAGFKVGNRIFLAVWNLSDKRSVQIPFGKIIKDVRMGYPKSKDVMFTIKSNKLTVFLEKDTARFFEIELLSE